jgi:hypothetical protein
LDGVSSERDCGHGMKKLCALITQFDSIYCVPILLVNMFVVQELGSLNLHYIPQILFSVKQSTPFL